MSLSQCKSLLKRLYARKKTINNQISYYEDKLKEYRIKQRQSNKNYRDKLKEIKKRPIGEKDENK